MKLGLFCVGVLYAVSAVVSIGAWITPITAHISPEGAYIGIDCDAGAFEKIAWTFALAFLFGGFALHAKITTLRKAARNYAVWLSVAALVASVIFKGLELRNFQIKTHSDVECQTNP